MRESSRIPRMRHQTRRFRIRTPPGARVRSPAVEQGSPSPRTTAVFSSFGRRRQNTWRMALLAIVIVSSSCGDEVSPAPSPRGTEPTNAAAGPYFSAGEVNALLADLEEIRYPSIGMQAGMNAVYFRCMSDAGFDVPPESRPIPRDVIRIESYRADASPFELADRAAVESSGYSAGQPKDFDSPYGPESDPLSIWIATLPPDRLAKYQEADLGTEQSRVKIDDGGGGILTVPGTGCLFESINGLWGSATDYYTIVSQSNLISSRIQATLATDSGLNDAKESWRHCLGDSGYTVDSPDLMPRNASEQGDRNLAVADWTCRSNSGLVAARGAALVAAANKLATDIESIRTTSRELIAAASVRAVALVSDGG